MFDAVGVHLLHSPIKPINFGDVEDDGVVGLDVPIAEGADEVGVSELECLQFEFEYAQALGVIEEETNCAIAVAVGNVSELGMYACARNTISCGLRETAQSCVATRTGG